MSLCNQLFHDSIFLYLLYKDMSVVSLSVAECQSWEDRWWPRRGLVLLASVWVWTEIQGSASRSLEQEDGKFCLKMFMLSKHLVWNHGKCDWIWSNLLTEAPTLSSWTFDSPKTFPVFVISDWVRHSNNSRLQVVAAVNVKSINFWNKISHSLIYSNDLEVPSVLNF